MQPNDNVSFQVLLRPAGGAAISAETATAARVAELRPDPAVAAKVQSWFSAHGLRPGDLVANSFSVVATVAEVEAAFGCRVRKMPGGGLGFAIRRGGPRRELAGATLPVELRDAAASVTFGEPMDFGPESFA